MGVLPISTQGLRSSPLRCRNARRPSKFIVLAESMKSAMNMAWEHGGAEFQSRFDKSTHGVLVPNAKLRGKIVPAPAERATETSSEDAHAQGEIPRMNGADCSKRVFDIDVEHCPNCGTRLKIIAAIEDPPVIVKILSDLGLPTRAPAQRFDLFQTI